MSLILSMSFYKQESHLLMSNSNLIIGSFIALIRQHVVNACASLSWRPGIHILGRPRVANSLASLQYLHYQGMLGPMS